MFFSSFFHFSQTYTCPYVSKKQFPVLFLKLKSPRFQKNLISVLDRIRESCSFEWTDSAVQTNSSTEETLFCFYFGCRTLKVRSKFS